MEVAFVCLSLLLFFLLVYTVRTYTRAISRLQADNELLEKSYKKIGERMHEMRIEKENLLGKSKFYSMELAGAKTKADKIASEFAEFKRVEVPKIRKQAVKKSKEVNTGFTSENFAMFMQGDLNPKDFRHLGDPIDFVVTCGADDVRNGVSDEVSEIVLLDVKTGNASLNKIQRRIRDAVVAGRVSFATLTINDEGVNYRFWRQNED